MTIEQKAKRYDETIEKLRNFYRDYDTVSRLIDVKEELANILPELDENEDDMVRKAILTGLIDCRDAPDLGWSDFGGINIDECIAWLEKQGKETSWKPSKEEMDVLYGLAYITNQYDEHKEEVITRLYQDLKREFFNGSSYENMFPTNTCTEDDVRRRSTIQVLEYARSLNVYNQYGKADIDKNIAWLEKQEYVGEIVSRCKTSWYNEGKIQGQIEGLSDEEKYQQGWHDALEKQGEPTDINPSEFDLRLNKLLKQFETLPKEELASSLSFYLNVVQNDGIYKREEKQGEQPRYSIGDVLCDKSCTTLNKDAQPNFEITDIRNGMYICDKCSFPISQQDEYELVAKKIEQKPAEWSEEDEWMLESIISDFYAGHKSSIGQDKWLKSLKPQNHWKPTEAQLASLTIACDRNDRIGFDLTQLLKELKKL